MSDHYTEWDPTYMDKGAYMYGNTFIEPPLPYYGQRPPWMIPPFTLGGQPLPPIIRPEHPYSYYQNPPVIPNNGEDNDDTEIDRKYLNVINVESKLKLSLDVTLYGVKEEDDIKITLEEGKKYTIIYLTEIGLLECTGILKYIDTTIPLGNTRYIGQYNNVVDHAHIILDCSAESKSDIRKVFVRSLRSIELIEDVEEEPPIDDDTEEEQVPPADDNTGTGEEQDPSADGSSSEDPQPEESI